MSRTSVDSPADPVTEQAIGGDVMRPGMRRRIRVRWTPSLVAILAIVSVCVAVAVYFDGYRPAREIDPTVQGQVLDIASRGTVATLSYSSATWDSDLATAKSFLTGEFLTYYSQFADQFIAPAVKGKRIDTKASVVKAAISELHPDRAVALVFVDQLTTTTDLTEPAPASSSVLVTLVRTENTWRISQFKPI